MRKQERISIIFDESDINKMADLVRLMNDDSSAFTPKVTRHSILRALVRQGVDELMSQLSGNPPVVKQVDRGSVLSA